MSCMAVFALLVVSTVSVQAGSWAVTGSICLGSNVVRVVADPHRSLLYAIDRVNSDVLIVDLTQQTIAKKLYVGKDPSDCDIDATGDLLFVANAGPGTGTPGSNRIGVIDLNNRTLKTSYSTPLRAEHVTAGKQGRLYFNAGFALWNGGDAHTLNTDTGADLGSFAGIKTGMVISSDKSRLYGQYIYDGNLGQMGVWDVSSGAITLVDTLGYSPYPYGWDYDNYCLSGNDRYLGYGYVMFNSTNLWDAIGIFPEQIHALNYDGSVAFGESAIWDATTFAIHGDATKIADLPFVTTVMSFDAQAGVLYAFNPVNKTIYQFEPVTAHGISYRWLTRFGLDTNDTVEAQDVDHDGITTLAEWTLDSNPTNSTPPFSLNSISSGLLTAENSSSVRRYEVLRTENLLSPFWEPIAEVQGTGSNLVINVTADMNLRQTGFYQLRVKVY